MKQASLFPDPPKRRIPEPAQTRGVWEPFDDWDEARMVPDPDWEPPEWLRLAGVDD